MKSSKVLPIVAFSILLGGPAAMAGVCSSSAPRATNQQLKGIWDILKLSSVSGIELVNELSKDPEIAALFQADAGVDEGFTIRKHSLMVLDVLAEQYSAFQAKYHMQFGPHVRAFETLKMTLALHDIGKPLAVQAGDKDRQHEFTTPILEREFCKFGFTDEEVLLAKALVDNDILGELVKGYATADETIELMRDLAASAHMNVHDYAPIQLLFYTSDAGSYPFLREGVFTMSNEGLLVPRAPQYNDFLKLF